jgi:hypothetical protein
MNKISILIIGNTMDSTGQKNKKQLNINTWIYTIINLKTVIIIIIYVVA